MYVPIPSTQFTFGSSRVNFDLYYHFEKNKKYGRFYTYKGVVRELKWRDIHIRPLNSYGTAFTPLVNVSRGSRSDQRIGDSILFVGCLGFTTTAVSNTPIPTTRSNYLIIDRQCNGASPSLTDVFESTGTTSAPNMYNFQRFDIINTSNNVTTDSSMSALHFSNNPFFCEIPIRYSGDVGDDINDFSCFPETCVMFPVIDTGTYLHARIFFIDM